MGSMKEYEERNTNVSYESDRVYMNLSSSDSVLPSYSSPMSRSSSIIGDYRGRKREGCRSAAVAAAVTARDDSRPHASQDSKSQIE